MTHSASKRSKSLPCKVRPCSPRILGPTEHMDDSGEEDGEDVISDDGFPCDARNITIIHDNSMIQLYHRLYDDCQR